MTSFDEFCSTSEIDNNERGLAEAKAFLTQLEKDVEDYQKTQQREFIEKMYEFI